MYWLTIHGNMFPWLEEELGAGLAGPFGQLWSGFLPAPPDFLPNLLIGQGGTPPKHWRACIAVI